jgi:glutamyl-Q tRNA(Asp) synthetase
MGKPVLGRFAPSPSGPLHMGSLLAALGSFLDAKSQTGRWLVRIEDVDTPRSLPGAAQRIINDLAIFGLQSDGPVVWQSARGHLYEAALTTLADRQHTFLCRCSRTDFEGVYPGTCRYLSLPHDAPNTAWRVKVGDAHISWYDRLLGHQQQSLGIEVGDFVVRRKDKLWAYQLAVVVDDAQQGITDVVRGQDLTDSTARQIYLQQLLGYPTPRYLHLPLIRAANGQKLSKQTGAIGIAALLAQAKRGPVELLDQCLQAMGFMATGVNSLQAFYPLALAQWEQRFKG